MVFVFQDPPSNPLPCFLVQVFITLIITRALGKLLAYIKQPRVIGEIIGGIVLGPSVLGNIPNFTNKIFPQSYSTNSKHLRSVDTFVVVADIGLIFFMFLIGLELDLGMIKKVWKQSIPLAAGSIIFPFGLGALMSLWWTSINDDNNGPTWTTPDKTSFILFCGTCLSFTAFPVLAAILKAAKIIRTEIGSLTMAAAAINDVVAWCILAVASSFSNTGKPNEGGYTTLLAVGFTLVMLLVMRPIVHYIYNRFRTRGDAADSSAFAALLILVLILSAFTAEVIGIHAFFGSFLAGVIVPKHGSLPQQLAPKIDLVIREFLLPLYFASSGIKTNIGAISDGKYWGDTVAIIAIATFAKVFPAYTMSKLVTKKPHRFCLTVGVLMNTRGLVELIALNVALQNHILSPRLFTMFVLMAIITTMMTAPAVHLLWVRHQRKQGELDSEDGPGFHDDNYLTANLDLDYQRNHPDVDLDDMVSSGALETRSANGTGSVSQLVNDQIHDGGDTVASQAFGQRSYSVSISAV